MVHLFQDTGRLNVKNAQKLHRAMAKGGRRSCGRPESVNHMENAGLLSRQSFLPEGEAA